MMSLLHQGKKEPLASFLRPKILTEFVGQSALLGEEGILRSFLDKGDMHSALFWGPPGSGKTTLAHLIAKHTNSVFVALSATSAGKKEWQEVVHEAMGRREMFGQKTIVFIDEIHRWNKAQQDALLPSVEDGTIILIGATTENPSFAVNSALLSRCRVYIFEKLSQENLVQVLKRGVEVVKKQGIQVSEEVLMFIASLANGDAREALNMLEASVQWMNYRKETGLTVDMVKKAIQRVHLLYDKDGEEHYNIISALHKSLRGSDVQASLYWLGRMLEAGEDPRYVARRLVRFASEDIGMADPQALVQATMGFQAVELVGMPECNVMLAQVVVYLAEAKKSNKLYVAYKRVQQDIKEGKNYPVPLHLRNGVTHFMKEVGYGVGYQYNPEMEGPVDQEYLPPELKKRIYFEK